VKCKLCESNVVHGYHDNQTWNPAQKGVQPKTQKGGAKVNLIGARICDGRMSCVECGSCDGVIEDITKMDSDMAIWIIRCDRCSTLNSHLDEVPMGLYSDFEVQGDIPPSYEDWSEFF